MVGRDYYLGGEKKKKNTHVKLGKGISANRGDCEYEKKTHRACVMFLINATTTTRTKERKEDNKKKKTKKSRCEQKDYFVPVM